MPWALAKISNISAIKTSGCWFLWSLWDEQRRRCLGEETWFLGKDWGKTDRYFCGMEDCLGNWQTASSLQDEEGWGLGTDGGLYETGEILQLCLTLLYPAGGGTLSLHFFGRGATFIHGSLISPLGLLLVSPPQHACLWMATSYNCCQIIYWINMN